MKRFNIYIGLLLASVIVLAIVFDMAYTYVYNNGTHRNKLMWVREMNNQQVDFIVLGSSRANNHIDPVQIHNATGKNGFNLGVNGFSAFESHLMLIQFLKKNKTKEVYVQVDSRYRQDEPDPIGSKVWLPFIYEDYIYNEFKSFGSEFKCYKQVPFYRYQKFESRLGYRDVVTSFMGKGFDYEPLSGYTPRYATLKEDKPYNRDKYIIQENTQINKIIERCNKEGVEVFFFTSPIYRFEGDITPLGKYLPNYHDFKDSIGERKLFGDQVHLNAQGAAHFTDMFIDNYFKK